MLMIVIVIFVFYISMCKVVQLIINYQLCWNIGHVLRVLGVCPGHSHCDDFTCKTANERARIPSLDQSQCLITVLSLRKVGSKTAWVWKWKLTLSDCTSSLFCWLPGDCWLSAGWWSFRPLMTLTPGLSEETVTDQIVCLSASRQSRERVHCSNTCIQSSNVSAGQLSSNFPLFGTKVNYQI